jgi:hypothetical protein
VAEAQSRIQAIKDSLAGFQNSSYGVNLSGYIGSIDGRAMGGPISGPGTGTSDDVLIRASNGEHMWTASEVQAAGGHAGVEEIRKWVSTGKFPTMISGSGSGGNSGPIAQVKVYPQPGMDEEQIGRAAAHTLEFAMRGGR